jgi:NAD(P)-dependent dehydrogenase (short-subunit alcohol dehydrogenase family)
MTKQIAVDCGPDGIRVNSVHPLLLSSGDLWLRIPLLDSHNSPLAGLCSGLCSGLCNPRAATANHHLGHIIW